MARKDRRFLGNLDAAADQQFELHFVESDHLAQILSKESNIVYGSKGVGKTALRRALTELKAKNFYVTKTIDLDKLSFTQVHAALSKLNETTQTEVATLARSIWRNVFATYCIEAVAETLPAGNKLKGEIDALLAGNSVEDTSCNERVTGQIERVFELIVQAGTADREAKNTPLGLSARQRSVINKFPSDEGVKPLLIECANSVISSGKFALICLDGFDSIVDHTSESRRTIFSGLIDAIHKCSTDPLFSGAFCFKAFLPQELTDGARAAVWDTDKHYLNTYFLRWVEQDFQTFLSRRMGQFTKKKSIQFMDIWHEYMPEKIRNDTYSIEEPSFGYILRHTLYRPRQILMHLQKMLDEWDKKSDSFRIDPGFIPPMVARTNYDLAHGVVNQLEVAHPGLSSFMKSWSGTPNTMLVAEFKERIKKIFGCADLRELHDLFDDLFNIGIFGVALQTNILKNTSQALFQFGFVGDRFARHVHATVKDTDFVALAPMFHEYCGCIPSEYGAIIPIEA